MRGSEVTLTGTVSNCERRPPPRGPASTTPRCAPCARGHSWHGTSADAARRLHRPPSAGLHPAPRGRRSGRWRSPGPLQRVHGRGCRCGAHLRGALRPVPAGTPTIGAAAAVCREQVHRRCSSGGGSRKAGADARLAAPAYARRGALIGNKWNMNCRMWPPCSNNGDQYVPPRPLRRPVGVETSWPLPPDSRPRGWGSAKRRPGLPGGSWPGAAVIGVRGEWITWGGGAGRAWDTGRSGGQLRRAAVLFGPTSSFMRWSGRPSLGRD